MADPGTIAVKVALTAASMALTAMQKTKGPRLESRKVTLADYGTPIWRFWGMRKLEGAPIFWAEDLREKKVETKTKGGKYAEYKYWGTWAVLLADHDIDAITRIWFDKHLIFDRTRKGPVVPILSGPFGADVKLKLGSKNARAYYGTLDQNPDRRMVEWCEDRYGVNTCPAYRGMSYIVFEEIPLEMFGNRIPQVTVEAIRHKTDAFPYDQAESAIDDNGGFTFDPSGRWMVHNVNDTFEWWDVANRQPIGTSYANAMGFAPNIAMTLTGTAYFIDYRLHYPEVGNVTRLLFVCAPGAAFPTVYECDASVGDDFECTRALQDNQAAAINAAIIAAAGGMKVAAPYETNFRLLTAYKTEAGYLDMVIHVDHEQSARDFCVDDDGVSWALFQPTGSSDAFTIQSLNMGGLGDGATFTTGQSARGGPNSARFCYVAPFEHFFVACDDYWFIIDRATWTITASGAVPWTGIPDLPQQDPERDSFWADWSEYSLEDGSLIRTVDWQDWVAGNTPLRIGYDPLNHALWSRHFGETDLTIRYLDRPANAGTVLADIVEEVAGWAGVTDCDASDLTQVVQGYSVVQGSAKDMIAPLLDIHDSDARPHDFGVQFIKRGDTPSLSLTTADFVRNGKEPRYSVAIAQDTDLPHEVTINFADVDRDQQANTVISRRPLDAMDSKRKETIDLSTYVSDPDEAQRLSDRRFRREWNERSTVKLSLTAQELALEPGDVRTLELDGVEWTARCTKVTLSGGALVTEWVRDFPGLATLGTGAGAPMAGRDPEQLFTPGATKGFVLDLPLISDTDANSSPLLAYGAGSYGTTWPGAVIWQDGAESFATIDSSEQATWGFATEALGDANPWLWDRGNSVNVKTFGGTLASVTEAQIDADPSLNLAYLGGELINFATATLEADGSYTLSGFKRGRRGTEWATGDHVAGEEFVLAADLMVKPVGLSEVGDALHFTAQSYGLNPAAGLAIDVASFSGASLKPYAPARIKWAFDGTDMQGTIIRRTRVGGSWNGSTIPLSENSEAYEVEIYSGATLKRTISVTGTNSFTYTAAMASADGLTVSAVPTFRAYQLSDAVGRGFALAA